jgi:hypothetical protein
MGVAKPLCPKSPFSKLELSILSGIQAYFVTLVKNPPRFFTDTFTEIADCNGVKFSRW